MKKQCEQNCSKQNRESKYNKIQKKNCDLPELGLVRPHIQCSEISSKCSVVGFPFVPNSVGTIAVLIWLLSLLHVLERDFANLYMFTHQRFLSLCFVLMIPMISDQFFRYDFFTLFRRFYRTVQLCILTRILLSTTIFCMSLRSINCSYCNIFNLLSFTKYACKISQSVPFKRAFSLQKKSRTISQHVNCARNWFRVTWCNNLFTWFLDERTIFKIIFNIFSLLNI